MRIIMKPPGAIRGERLEQIRVA
ncbi:MAG: hypothetical protein JWN95_1384, partial [Frankiales bacterium]|nr:hypothetical protein [Frankiales bacterium]